MRPPISTGNPDGLLLVARAKAQFSCAEQAIDDQDVLMDASVGDLGLALGTDDEDRWHFALHDATREFNIDAAAVVIDGDGLPRWIVVAGQAIAVIAGI
ncbi:hypothetical protein GCM10008943_27950 [Paenochrobactrum glaciei]|uniref:Uncharacterized protein n=1 Tax=Paenochrobactrum glaciei TaxID=486407 RepID=A0ABN1GGR1_9HYPH